MDYKEHKTECLLLAFDKLSTGIFQEEILQWIHLIWILIQTIIFETAEI